ncbi:PepSY domain-containing protein [Halomonas urmiana]|uniref:PepSY domain-containing protein n=1 Tax=Halomonas urmiana TaxID=490901 RepID=A0A5R8MJ91_9GAMM|nr:PepSY domain-containing protein [Halomonas urmiana]TLF52059.1 PepSY domain-containing protein [Halomonas urmiana]
MQRTMILAGSLAALMSVATLAQAEDERLATERLDEILAHASAFGFQSFEEIEVERNDRFSVEGWLDDEWRAEVRFSLESGESLKEERNRREGGAWGMSEAEIREAMALATAEGLAEFEELEVYRNGRIEIEGRDADGRELEVRSRGGALLEVEQD